MHHIHIIGVPEGKEREKGTENILEEITAKNFPNMGKKPLTQIQEAQRVPYKIKPKTMGSSFRTSTQSPHITRPERAQRHWPCQVGFISNSENWKLPLLPVSLLTFRRMCKTFRATIHSSPSGLTRNTVLQN